MLQYQLYSMYARRIGSPSHNATRLVLRWHERTDAMAAKPKEVIDTFCTRNTLTQRGTRSGKHF